MKCPFSGKPCLHPKEVFVTEVDGTTVKNLFLCRECGDKYLENIENAEVVTTKMEVISSDKGITHSEEIIDNSVLDEPAIKEDEIIEEEPPKPSIILQIKKIEQRMERLVSEEKYEGAAKLRDIIKDLKEELKKENDQTS